MAAAAGAPAAAAAAPCPALPRAPLPQAAVPYKRRRRVSETPTTTVADRVQSLILGSLGTLTSGTMPPFVESALALARAREMDMDYCRHVQGACHARTLSAVWGPRDGCGLNTIDARR